MCHAPSRVWSTPSVSIFSPSPRSHPHPSCPPLRVCRESSIGRTKPHTSDETPLWVVDDAQPNAPETTRVILTTGGYALCIDWLE